MKTKIHFFLIAISCFTLAPMIGKSQSLLGTWQLVKEISCLEAEMEADSNSNQDLVSEMKQLSSPAPQVVRFKAKGNAEESTRILQSRKSANSKNFLYKYTGASLLILDKKSQTLADSYTVDKLSSDSLIVSNSSKPCHTKIFLKIKDPR
jgi:hypothetical protein